MNRVVAELGALGHVARAEKPFAFVARIAHSAVSGMTDTGRMAVAPSFMLATMRRSALVLLVLVASLAFARSASADVLVSALPKRLVCGAPIKPAIWAQPQTTGDRTVRMRAVDRRSGTVWWRKTAKARTRGGWREWYLPSGMDGRCRPTKFVYELSNGVKVAYRIRFKSEGV